MWETWVQSLAWEDLLEKEMATHSSTLAWKSLWLEEPSRLQFMGSQRVGHNWATSRHCTCMSAARLLAWWHMLHRLWLLSCSQGQIPSSDLQPYLWPICPCTFFLLIKKIWDLLIYIFLAALALHCWVRAFSSCNEWEATLHCSAQAAFCGDFSCYWAWALGWAVFSTCALQAPECWFSSCDSQTYCSTACGIFPNQESNPCPLHWQVVLNHWTAREAFPWFLDELLKLGGLHPLLRCPFLPLLP